MRHFIVLLRSNWVSSVRQFIVSSEITDNSAPISTLKFTLWPFTKRDTFHEVLPVLSVTASRKEASSNSTELSVTSDTLEKHWDL